MKKKLTVLVFIFLIIGLITGMLYGYYQRKKLIREWAEGEIRSIDYWEQNVAFGMDASLWESGYQGYDIVDEKEMYVRLEVYNSWNKKKNNGREVLCLADIEDYLSSEYNEDGSFRVTNRSVEIQEYIKWFFGDGNGEIEEYWDELQTIGLNYERKHQGIELATVKKMTIDQLQELINKYNDPSYEINAEIMGEQE